MKPKRIILIRHGESEGNVERNIYGQKPDYALELTSKGRMQALETGKALKDIIQDESVFFYISPMWRTRSTFEEIAKSFERKNYKYLEEPRLREQEWGHLRTPEEGQLVEKERNAFGTFYFRIPDGESAADVYDRVSDFFGTLHRDFEKEKFQDNAVIVTHGMTIRLFLMRWFHWTVEQFELLANPANCEMIIMERLEDGKYRLTAEPRKWDKTEHSFQRPLSLQS